MIAIVVFLFLPIGSTIFVPQASGDIESWMPIHQFTIDGRLFCRHENGEEEPTSGVVQIWERDTITADDLIANVTAGADGRFEAKFVDHEVGSLDPYYRIWHGCGTEEAGVKSNCVTQTQLDDLPFKEPEAGDIVEVRLIVTSVPIYNCPEEESEGSNR
ncbi:Transthyretin domain containing protein [Aphelenchoides besseyi]|nr:Transthyretin domain containing protein [Aphelenchoides besseyi]KAI6198676.1 Transthyretin domain containing protein [Aphelenchoides besseyi]